MMQQRKVDYRPRIIDRAVFGLLAALHILSALYLVGPWYLETGDLGKSPLMNLFENPTAVIVYGVFVFMTGIGLLYATAANGKHYTTILSYSLLVGFLLRLYALIGVIASLDSWRPPSYLSQSVIVLLMAAYWLWVKYCVRPIQ